jgi:hypothetical protein
VVELAPAVLPPLLYVRDERVRERGEHAVGGGPIGGELDPAERLGLLEPFGCELDEAGSELLGPVREHGDGCADQLKMFRSLSKKPWWWR